MLKKCPYCGRELPIRRRFPNGFGQISEIKGKNLKKPFRVMVTVGKKDNGKPICKLLKPVAYFETFEEAYLALEQYHAYHKVTMDELYRLWFAEWSKTTTRHPQDAHDIWAFCSSVHNIPVQDITDDECRTCLREGYVMENGEKRFPRRFEKGRIIGLFKELFAYAKERGILEE